MKIQNANDLKPSKSEISHIQTLLFRGEKKMVQQWSVYFDGSDYHLTKGLIFNERQNHTVYMSKKKYEDIARFLNTNPQ